VTEWLRSGAAEICVDHRGTAGPLPIIFLHAGVADRRMWSKQLSALAPAFEVIAYDRRGFGETRSADEPFSHAGDLAALLDHYQFPRVMLVGASQGGRIAIDFAISNPDRVAGMVLIAPAVSGESSNGYPHPGAVLALIDQIEGAEQSEDLETLNALEARAWLDGPLAGEGRVAGDVRELFLDMNAIALRAPQLSGEVEPPAAMERLGTLSMPVLLLWGTLDFPHVQELSQRLAAELPNARAMVVDEAAHLPNMEKPEMISLLIGEYARGVAG